MGWKKPGKVLLVFLILSASVLASGEDQSSTAGHHRHSGRRNNSGRRKVDRRVTSTEKAIVESEVDVADGDHVEAAAAVAASSTRQHRQDHPPGIETCEVARLKCAYRVGCGMALQNYMMGCSDVITASSQRCSDHCRNSLIALTSTEEGEALMKCKCSDSFCFEAKQRIDICRTAVLRATHNSTTVSCSVAQWICMADPLCSTALDYYNRFCRSMFTGKKCTVRCKNSISILRRQEKAAKLSTCVCDGTEDYDCPSILDNMDRLCFGKGDLRPSTSSARPPHRIEGGGQGVEDRNDMKNNYDGRAANQSGHHPGHHHHHQQQGKTTTMLHPTKSTTTTITDDVIDSNEVEIRRHPHKPNSSPAPSAQLFLLTVSTFLAAISRRGF